MRYYLAIASVLTLVFFFCSKTESPRSTSPTTKQTVTKDIGWVELVSSPVQIVSDGEMSGTVIGLKEIEFKLSDMTYTAIVTPHANGDLSPLPPPSPWEKGDEVYIVSIPNSNGVQTNAYLAINHRQRRQ